MNSQPTTPFQSARELIKSRLAGTIRGTLYQPGKIVLQYRISGGPPGKRLLRVLRISGEGDVTYEDHDELRRRKPIRAKTTMPVSEGMAVLREVEGSGLLNLRETGGGFLPDSIIGSIGIEIDGAEVQFHFLADEDQVRSQRKETLPPIRELRIKFEALCERVRKIAKKQPRETKGKKRR